MRLRQLEQSPLTWLCRINLAKQNSFHGELPMLNHRQSFAMHQIRTESFCRCLSQIKCHRQWHQAKSQSWHYWNLGTKFCKMLRYLNKDPNLWTKGRQKMKTICKLQTSDVCSCKILSTSSKVKVGGKCLELVISMLLEDYHFSW